MSNENKEKFTSRYTFEVNFFNKKIDLSILSNSNNTYIAYHIDHNVYNTYKNKYNLNITFNIQKSMFCNTFLDINSYKNDGLDRQNKFCGIFTQYKDILYYDLNQSIVFNKIVKGSSILENKLDIYVIKLTKFKDSFLYCICNRQFIDKRTYKNIIRSSSFCMYSRDCYKYLNNLYKKYKTTGLKIESAEDAMSSLFNSDSNLTPQQKQNGFTL